MKQLIVAGIIGLASASVFAGGEDQSVSNFNYGPYVGVHGGVAIPGGQFDNHLKTGPDAGAQVGYQIGSLRLEGAFTYLSNTASFNNHLELRMTTLMANGYYDFSFTSIFSPYIGAGMGWVHAWGINTQNNFNTPDDNEFAYQGMAGIRFHATHHFVVDLGYHRLGWTDGNGAQNLIEVGLSYAF